MLQFERGANAGLYNQNRVKEVVKHLHCLVDDPGLLQQVLGDLGPYHRPATRELHLQVFAKATGVLVDDGAGVAEGLHQAVDQKDFLLESPVVSLGYKKKKKSTVKMTTQNNHFSSSSTKASPFPALSAAALTDEHFPFSRRRFPR